jgi:hypothetical protein
MSVVTFVFANVADGIEFDKVEFIDYYDNTCQIIYSLHGYIIFNFDNMPFTAAQASADLIEMSDAPLVRIL